MNTPIYDFVQNYIKSNTARLHMPGHKGVSFLGCEAFDITEIKGADELYAPDGIIKKSEENATRIFDTVKTIYSAGGSSQSINAMLYLAYQKADKQTRPFVLAGRNAHKSFIYALAKLDADVEWIYPENTDSICSCIVNGEMVENCFPSTKKSPPIPVPSVSITKFFNFFATPSLNSASVAAFASFVIFIGTLICFFNSSKIL
jgi:arginine/lysine/ornithine decarboxylase